MKKAISIISLIAVITCNSQEFDFYGPQPFGDILDNSYNQSWTPSAISSISNLTYIVLLDAETKSNAISLNTSDIEKIDWISVGDVHGSSSTYGSVMKSIFQMVDNTTHLDNGVTSLSGEYRLNPLLHSYFALNANDDAALICSDAGSYFIDEGADAGYLLITFEGTASSAMIKAVNQYEYTSELVEVTDWTEKWLQINDGNLKWTINEDEASNFYLADATDLISLEIEDGSAFNPLTETYQPNATAALPDDATAIENSKIIDEFERDLDELYLDQLGNSTTATSAASDMLDAIESKLAEASSSLRYPKAFYLALRENMLSHEIASSDIYGGRLGYQTVPNVYFTNAVSDGGIPHPFMVVTAHAVSTRPNLLVDVNRPPGAEQGVGYAESTVTRNGKLGEFLLKIPLKDYGLIDNLLDNDLSEIGSLVSDYDAKQGTTTDPNEYNYAGLASIGVAVDGVTIYPAFNNNLRFAVEDGEVTHSGIHVGGGLELHYHVDGHAFNGNGINLYNITDYDGNDHPPVIGVGYDGIALFGKYEANYSAMTGYSVDLDEYGGHDHGDDFGYHYHAHTQNVESESGQLSFDEHFLLVGAWKGNVNNIPGFDEGKTNQFQDASIARYVGATYTEVEVAVLNVLDEFQVELYPNPTSDNVKLTFIDSSDGAKVEVLNMTGQLKSVQYSNGEQEMQIDLGKNSGVLILKVTFPDGKEKILRVVRN